MSAIEVFPVLHVVLIVLGIIGVLVYFGVLVWTVLAERRRVRLLKRTAPYVRYATGHTFHWGKLDDNVGADDPRHPAQSAWLMGTPSKPKK